MNKNLFLLLLTTAAASGCNLAPQYNRPEAPVPAEWPSGAAYPDIPTATDATDVPELAWQEFFSDEKLRSLIEIALRNNRDLRIAALNVERARALYGIQRSGLLPRIEVVGSGGKRRIPDVSGFGRALTLETYEVDLGISAWEIDFFGRLRNLKDRALEEYLATEQARRSAQILLVSSVANVYLVLAADRENLALAQTTLANQEDAYDLIERRYDLGLAPELDLYRAQTQVDTARGDVARFVQLVAQDENALNFLLGAPALSELVPPDLNDVTFQEEISPGLPSEVLLRRPDVLQAESLLRAAHADIGAARAAFFPRISLTAAMGTASSDLSGLFKPGSEAWSYAPRVAMPIFDARTWPAHRAAKVQREIALAQYERAIQGAFREVADALAVLGTVDQQVAAQESLVNAVAETYRLSVTRYERGIDNYLSVLDAQRSLYAAQRGLVVLRLARLTNQVRLYAVLGGGSGSSSETMLSGDTDWPPERL